MTPSPGQTIYVAVFTRNPTTGALQDPDGAAASPYITGGPTLALFEQGAAYSPTVTVSHTSLGEYWFSYAVGAAGNCGQARVTYTVSSFEIAAKEVASYVVAPLALTSTQVQASAAAAITAAEPISATTAGTGAFTISVPVTNSTSNPLQGVTITLSAAGQYATAVTNSAGIATLYANDGTYGLAAVLNGWQVNGTIPNVIVNGANITTPTIVMSPTAVPLPPNPTQCTVAAQVLSNQQVPQINYTISFQMTAVPPGSGWIISDQISNYSTNGSGYLFATLYQGASYNVIDSVSNTVLLNYTVPSTSTAQMPNILL